MKAFGDNFVNKSRMRFTFTRDSTVIDFILHTGNDQEGEDSCDNFFFIHRLSWVVNVVTE